MTTSRGIGFELALRRRGIPILRRHAVIEVVGGAADGMSGATQS
jgi:hypothetical protein